MRNLKKFLAVVVAIAVMMTAMVPAFAAEVISADAQTCQTLKVLKGDGNGVNAEYLAKDTKRIQAAIILLRLLGKEAEALAFDATGKETFKDADKVLYQGGKNILAYLKANSEYGFIGYTNGNFGVEDVITAQQIYKVLLQAMGYAVGTDFEYANTVAFAEGKGLTKVAGLEQLTNNDLATAIVETLKGTEKGGKTLVEKLVADKVVAQADAEAAGLIATAVTATVAQSEDKKISVTFNTAVDTTKATFAVKKGLVAVNVKATTWDADKKVATLEFYSALDGEYVVTVGGIAMETTEYTVKATASVVDAITFSDTKLIKNRAGTGASVGYKVANQFGQDITSTTTLTIVASVYGTHTASAGVVTINNGSLSDDSTVVVSLVAANGKNATATLTVKKAPAAVSLTLGDLKNADSKVLRESTVVTTDVFAFDVDAKDQYGTAVDTAADLVSDFEVVVPTGVTTAWESKTDSTPAKLKITALPQTSGKNTQASYTIIVVCKATGASTVKTFTVQKDLVVTTFSMSAPTDLIAAGESAYIAFTAADQDGNAITKFDDLSGKITFALTAGTVAFEKNAIDGTAKLKFTAGASAGSVTVTSTPASTITIDVKDAAKATRIDGIKDLATKLAIGASTTISKDNFSIKDQYERAITLPSTWKIKLSSSESAKVTVSGDVYNSTPTITAVEAANSTFTATLNDGTADVTDGAYQFTVSAVSKADIVSYVIDDIGTLYSGAALVAEQAAYAKAVSIYGKDSSGNKIVIASSDIVNVSSTSTNMVVSGNTVKGQGDVDETATVVATINGNSGIVTATKAVTLSKAAPVGTDIVAKEVDANGVKVMTVAEVEALLNKVVSSNAQFTSNRAAVYFEILDQYGVASTAVMPAYFTISAKDAAGNSKAGYTINATTGEITAVSAASGDVVTITGISKDGKVATIKIIVA